MARRLAEAALATFVMAVCSSAAAMEPWAVIPPLLALSPSRSSMQGAALTKQILPPTRARHQPDKMPASRRGVSSLGGAEVGRNRVGGSL